MGLRVNQFLHDSRAPTIEEVVLMHGGEAQAAHDAFANLSERNLNRIMTFLRGI